jgi:hypothetical protein
MHVEQNRDPLTEHNDDPAQWPHCIFNSRIIAPAKGPDLCTFELFLPCPLGERRPWGRCMQQLSPSVESSGGGSARCKMLRGNRAGIICLQQRTDHPSPLSLPPDTEVNKTQSPLHIMRCALLTLAVAALSVCGIGAVGLTCPRANKPRTLDFSRNANGFPVGPYGGEMRKRENG